MPVTTTDRPTRGSGATVSAGQPPSPSRRGRARAPLMTSLVFALVVLVAAVGGVGPRLWRSPTPAAATGEVDVRLAATCPSPRPPVHVSVGRIAPGSLGVQVTAGWGALQSLRFGPASNAVVSVPGWPDSTTGGFEVT